VNIHQPPGYWSRLALPLAGFYGFMARLRVRLYVEEIFKTRRLASPVVSVGNLTVGGTGKTPTAMFLASRLAGPGRRPAILSRGYGRRSLEGFPRGEVLLVSDGSKLHCSPIAAGDEPYLMALKLPGVPVLCHHRRFQAGRWAEEHLKADLFILDDGFQHLGLHRDFNLLLMDGAAPLGNGQVLPAGPLREPPRALRRADAILLTRATEADRLRLQPLLERWSVRAPVFTSDFTPSRLIGPEWSDRRPVGDLAGRKAVAFCGLARPEQFFRMLEELNVELAERIVFDDHQSYGPSEQKEIDAACRRQAPDLLLTTEKDLVKLAGNPFPAPLLAVEISLALHQDGLLELIEARLANRLAGK